MEIKTTYPNKKFLRSTEDITRLVVLVIGLVAALFGVPEEMTTELESAAVEAVVAIGGLVTATVVVWSFISERGERRSATFIQNFTDQTGWQTPEFWIGIAGTIIGFLGFFNLVNAEQSSTLLAQLTQIIQALFAILAIVFPQIFYAQSRLKVKEAIAAENA